MSEENETVKKPWKITAIMALIYLSLGFAEWGDPGKFFMNTALFLGAVAVVWVIYYFKNRSGNTYKND